MSFLDLIFDTAQQIQDDKPGMSYEDARRAAIDSAGAYTPKDGDA